MKSISHFPECGQPYSFLYPRQYDQSNCITSKRIGSFSFCTFVKLLFGSQFLGRNLVILKPPFFRDSDSYVRSKWKERDAQPNSSLFKQPQDEAQNLWERKNNWDILFLAYTLRNRNTTQLSQVWIKKKLWEIIKWLLL